MTEPIPPVLADASGCAVSVVIKTLNEERNIAGAIESALAALAVLDNPGGEVIVADSASSDRSIEIATGYPITVVQLANPHERCCGIGPQLGYQFASGSFIYILDGDMQLRADFLREALAFLQAHPQAAGVAGRVVEHNLNSLEYRARGERGSAHMQAGSVDRLDGGGLYRRSAIEQIGHLSDRNLHSYEELDLAVRLRAAGWTLHRIDCSAVDHKGHDVPAHRLLLKRWKSGYINGIGEVIAAARGSTHRPLLLAALREAKLYAAFSAWLLLGLLVATLQPSAMRALGAVGLLIALPWAALVAKKRSLAAGTYALISLSMHVGGLLRGLFSRRRLPQEPIAAREIKRSSLGPSESATDSTHARINSVGFHG